MDLLDRLLLHDYWATHTLLEFSRDLTDAQLDQRFDIGRGTLRGTYQHIVFNIEFWTAMMEGTPCEPARAEHSVTALMERHNRDHARFAAFSRRAFADDRFDETFRDHYDVFKSLGSTILVVMLHATEHRTEAIHVLHRLGLPDVPEVDHGAWDYEQLNLPTDD